MRRFLTGLMGNYAVLASGELLSKIAGFLAFAYLARVLGPDAYGAVEFALALVMVFGLVIDFGLGPIGAREVTGNPDRARALVEEIPTARLLLAIPSFFAMIACIILLNQPSETKQLVLIFAFSLFAGPWMLNWLFQGLDRMGWVAIANPLRMLIFAAGAVLLVDNSTDLLLVGLIEVGSVAMIAIYFILAARWNGITPSLSFEQAALVHLLREALPVGISSLLWVLNQYLPTLFLGALGGGAALAFYGAGHRIIMSLNSFIFLYFFNLYPSIVRAAYKDAPGIEQLVGHSFRFTSWLGILVGLVGTLLAEPICRVVYGEAFGPAGAPLVVLVWVLPVALLSGHARFCLIGTGHQRFEMAAQAWGVSMTLGISVLLIPSFGTVGAAVALLAGTCIVWVAAHAYARKRIGPIPFAGPLWRPALAGAVAAGLCMALPAELLLLRLGSLVASYLLASILLDPKLVQDVQMLLRSTAGTTASGTR